MSRPIFKEIQDAIKTRSPDLLIFRGMDPKEFGHVMEGLRHPTNHLEQDATLWQQGSGGQVHVVIQVTFFQRREDRIGARLWISRANPHGGCTVREYGILPPVNDPDGSPTIAFNEFFAGNCPPGIDPEGSIVLDLERLRGLARAEIRALGRLPNE
ncbi:hypothetical protein HOY80DRAFT_1109940 [Tuber brumale]|nr:hypothetical protein HOY80DRAFT_1109940 [Tuber brumale]